MNAWRELPMTEQQALDGEVRVISDALANSALLHQLVGRMRMHAQAHADPRTCDMCYAWVEYFYGLTGRSVPERYTTGRDECREPDSGMHR